MPGTEDAIAPQEPTSPEEAAALDSARNVAARADSEALIRRIVDMAPVGFCLVDGRGRIVLINPAAAELFKYAPEGLVGAPIEQLVPPEHRDGHAAQRSAYIRAPEPRPMGTQRDLEGVCKDGARVTIEVGLVPVSLPDGAHVLASIVDITARKRAEAEQARLHRELRELNAHLEKRNADLEDAARRENELKQQALAADRAKTSFLATVSHELRTPLNAIIGFTELLEQEVHGELGDPRYREYASTVVENGRRMHAVVARVLELSRAAGGDLPCRPDDVGADALVRSALDQVSTTRPPDVELDIPEGLHVHVDRALARRILVEVLDNALRHAGTAARVYVGAAPRGDGGVHVVVRDDGAGMAAETAEEALRAFDRPHVAYTRHQHGLGIGLALAKAEASVHGGTLTLDSEPGVGTTVTVELAGRLAGGPMDGR